MNMKAREKRKPGFLASISMIIVLLALVVYSGSSEKLNSTSKE